MYCCLKLVNGAYLISVAVVESKKGLPCDATRAARGHLLTKKVLFSVFACFVLEFIICILENAYGPDGSILLDGVSVDGYFQPSDTRRTMWMNNQVFTTNNGTTTPEVVNLLCTMRSWHTMECTGNAVWCFFLICCCFYWKYMGEIEK